MFNNEQMPHGIRRRLQYSVWHAPNDPTPTDQTTDHRDRDTLGGYVAAATAFVHTQDDTQNAHSIIMLIY